MYDLVFLMCVWLGFKFNNYNKIKWIEEELKNVLDLIKNKVFLYWVMLIIFFLKEVMLIIYNGHVPIMNKFIERKFLVWYNCSI